MRYKLVFSLVLLFSVTAKGQLKKGTVYYEASGYGEIKSTRGGEEIVKQLTPTRLEKFQLDFDSTQSLWKKFQQKGNVIGVAGDNQVKIVMASSGPKNILYTNFETNKTVEQVDFLNELYIVDDSIEKFEWKITPETITYLNHKCFKATAIKVRNSSAVVITNGKIENKKVLDTINILAWYTLDFPVSAGPSKYQGGLPGLILELNINEGKQLFSAVEISDILNTAAIKEPNGKKRYTREEFEKKKEKVIKEMQQNH